MRTWIIVIVAGIALATAASHAPDAWAQDSCMAVAEALEHYQAATKPAYQAAGKADRAYSTAIYACMRIDLDDFDATLDAQSACERRAKQDLDDAWDAAEQEIAREEQEYIQIVKEAYDGPRSESPSVTDRLMGQWEQQCLRQFGYIK